MDYIDFRYDDGSNENNEKNYCVNISKGAYLVSMNLL